MAAAVHGAATGEYSTGRNESLLIMQCAHCVVLHVRLVGAALVYDAWTDPAVWDYVRGFLGKQPGPFGQGKDLVQAWRS